MTSQRSANDIFDKTAVTVVVLAGTQSNTFSKRIKTFLERFDLTVNTFD